MTGSAEQPALEYQNDENGGPRPLPISVRTTNRFDLLGVEGTSKKFLRGFLLLLFLFFRLLRIPWNTRSNHCYLILVAGEITSLLRRIARRPSSPYSNSVGLALSPDLRPYVRSRARRCVPLRWLDSMTNESPCRYR